jgi:cation:H+ antiporter
MVVAKSTVKKDIPWAAMAALLLALLCVDDMNSPHLWGNDISRSDGLILLFVFIAFMIYTFNAAKKEGQMPSEEELEDMREKPKDYSKLGLNIFWIVLGLACLILGSDLFVDAASYVAYRYGVRQSVVGLTIVAGGTSLPELATTVVAARKGQSALAIGNVIGSNVFNILLILGLTATIHPLQIEGITTIDMAVMLLSVTFVWLFAFTRFKVERWEGFVLLIGYLAYLTWLIISL